MPCLVSLRRLQMHFHHCRVVHIIHCYVHGGQVPFWVESHSRWYREFPRPHEGKKKTKQHAAHTSSWSYWPPWRFNERPIVFKIMGVIGSLESPVLGRLLLNPLSARSSLIAPFPGSGNPCARCIWRMAERYDLTVPWQTRWDNSATYNSSSCSPAGIAGTYRD